MRRHRFARMLAGFVRFAREYPYLCRGGAVPWAWAPATPDEMDAAIGAGVLAPFQSGLYVRITDAGQHLLTGCRGGEA